MFLTDRILLTLLFAPLLLTLSHGQTNVPDKSTTVKESAWHQKSNAMDILYVHTDKTIYTNNEDIWFSAYLIQSESERYSRHNLLSASLVGEDTREVVFNNRYVMEAGLGFGSIHLPDTVIPGDYRLIYHTNVLGRDSLPTALFEQSITIKSITSTNFTAKLTLLDSIAAGEFVCVAAEVSAPGDRKSLTEINYRLNDSPDTEKIKFQNERRVILRIPAYKLTGEQPVLLASINRNGDSQHFSLPLPATNPGKSLRLSFYPEGGSLITGVKSIVGFETKDEDNTPLEITGILYENGHPIDTLQTNSYGIGRFYLLPRIDCKYVLKVNTPFSEDEKVFGLPPANDQGVVLHLPKSMIDDTLRFQISGSDSQKVKISVHDQHQEYAAFDMLSVPGGAAAKVIMENVPKTLLTVTVSDTMGRPLAERLFFALNDRRMNTEIEAQDTLNTREKTGIKITIRDETGKPVHALVSAAVVQSNRLLTAKRKDIAHYVYLERQLGSLPPALNGNSMTNSKYVEDIMLVYGWRRYTWQNALSTSNVDTIAGTYLPKISGQVLYKKKSIRQPLSVSIFENTDKTFRMVKTDSTGRFDLTRDDLLVDQDGDLLLSVNVERPHGYEITITDPFEKINRQLALNMPRPAYRKKQEVSSVEQQLNGLERTVQLNEVTINASRNGDVFGMKARGANECGDFVDLAGRLNFHASRNSAGNRPPVKGQQYIDGVKAKRLSDGLIIDRKDLQDGDRFTTVPIIYQGCENDSPFIFRVKGIYTEREFYGATEKTDDVSGPQYLSTLYWQSGLVTDQSGSLSLSFYTGDIEGEFMVILQGISLGNDDVISAEQSFIVNRDRSKTLMQ